MDWAHVYEQIATGSPLAASAAVVAVVFSAYRAMRATLGRFGERVGRLEQARAADRQAARLERVRRWQLECALLNASIPVPPWPDHADDVIVPAPRHALPDWTPAL